MKRIWAGSLLMVFLFGSISAAYSWPWDSKPSPSAQQAPEPQKPEPAVEKPAPVPEKQVKPAPVPDKKKIDKEKAMRDRVRVSLNNTMWDIELTPTSGKGKKMEDTLFFRDNKFGSVEVLKQGFRDSNYTLTVFENGISVLETMQSGDSGVIFWRVEFDAAISSCKGVLSRQLSDVKSEDFSFTSIKKRPYQPPVAEVAAPKE